MKSTAMSKKIEFSMAYDNNKGGHLAQIAYWQYKNEVQLLTSIEIKKT